MKRCPECRRDYYDDTLLCCLDDGSSLLDGPAFADEPATAIFAGNVDLRSSVRETPARIVGGNSNSVAVLPFKNISADPDNEYFCEGLAEELLNALSKIEGLKVAGRTSAFYFKGKDADISEIGQKLGVANLLEGSVRKSGDRLRIAVQLLNSSNGYHLWSETYDRKMLNIFDVQDEITCAVLDALKLRLLGGEKSGKPVRKPQSVEALDLYLKGRFLFQQHTAGGFETAAECFQKAIDADNRYALAHAGLSSVLIFQWFFGLVPADEAIPKAKDAALMAIELDPDLDEAHIALGHVLMFYERDLFQAEREYSEAIRQGPQNAYARYQYALCLAVLGRPDQAVLEAEKAIELDPLSVMANFQVAGVYYQLGLFDEALRYAQRLIEMAPGFYGGHLFKAATILSRGQSVEAAHLFESALALDDKQDMTKSCLGTAYGLSGERQRALALLDQLKDERERRCVNALHIARIYDSLGDIENTLEWLEKALEEHNGELVYMRLYAKLDRGNYWGPALCSDSRFQDFLKRLGLPE